MSFRESPLWSDKFRRVYLPYSLQRLEDGRWVVLNRNYKPIGMHDTHPHVDYTDYAVRAKIDTQTLRKLSYSPLKNDTSQIWLYNDGCIPDGSNAQDTQRYFERLRMLDAIDTYDFAYPVDLERLFTPHSLKHLGGSNWQVYNWEGEPLGGPVYIHALRNYAFRYAKQRFEVYTLNMISKTPLLDAEITEPTDLKWTKRSKLVKQLLARTEEESPIGDLARDAARDDTFPMDAEADDLFKYFRPWKNGAFDACVEFLDELDFDVDYMFLEERAEAEEQAVAEHLAESGTEMTCATVAQARAALGLSDNH